MEAFLNNNNSKQTAIISIILLLIFAINLLLFKLGFILSFIYIIILLILLYFHYIEVNEDLYGNIKEKVSIALISESVIISFNEFYYSTTKWIFFTENVKLTIAPNMLTLIISILYALSLFLRNHIRININPKDLAINILDILFFSSLISVLISNDYFYIPIIGETNFTPQSFCLFLLVLSWVGMKSLNIFIFPIIALLALGRIGEVNKAMGIVGIFYLLFSYTSLVIQFSDNKSIHKIYKNSFNEFSNDFQFKENAHEKTDSNYSPLLNKNE